MNNIPVIAFFNSKGGVGKTSLVYHLAWMYADLGYKTLAVDLDPQANLTAAFLEDDRLEQIWPDGEHPETIYGCIQPLLKGVGDIALGLIDRGHDLVALLLGQTLVERASAFHGDPTTWACRRGRGHGARGLELAPAKVEIRGRENVRGGQNHGTLDDIL